MKYFITSDTHSYCKELKKALKEAGYDKKNKEHVFILCGDLLDRGDETVKIVKFIRSIPKSRRILIRGNHEDLFCELVRRKVAYQHDLSNRTLKSLLQLNGHQYEDRDIYDLLNFNYDELMSMIAESCETETSKEYVRWVNSNEWVDYFDLDTPKEKFTFVHSFIPLDKKPEYKWEKSIETYSAIYDKDWRKNYVEYQAKEARWGTPFNFIDAGLFPEDRTLVCGHWHVAADDQVRSFRAHYFKGENYEDLLAVTNNNDVFRGHKIIGLDACTAYSGQVNVMVIDEEGNTYQHNRILEKEDDSI